MKNIDLGLNFISKYYLVCVLLFLANVSNGQIAEVLKKSNMTNSPKNDKYAFIKTANSTSNLEAVATLLAREKSGESTIESLSRTYYKSFTINDSSNQATHSLDDALIKFSNTFKITPLKLIGEFNPSIELSYERRTRNNASTQIMASYMLPISVWYINGGVKPNYRGFGFSFEEKFYYKKSAPLGPYWAFELNYLNNRHTTLSNFGVEEIYSDTTYSPVFYPDTFVVKKQIYSFNIKLGYQKVIKRISFDFYLGLGLRYKDVKHFNRINPNDKMEIPRHPNVYYSAIREGKYWTISIPLNVRVGWTF